MRSQRTRRPLVSHPLYRKDNPMGTLHNPPGPDAAAELTNLGSWIEQQLETAASWLRDARAGR